MLEKPESSDIPEWLSFISFLYADIKAKKYNDMSVEFEVPLNKIQLYKLKKILAEDEQIFVTDISGIALGETNNG